MNILIFSSSKANGYGWMEYPEKYLMEFFKGKKNLVFVPYAGVNVEYKGDEGIDAYTNKVADKFAEMNLNVKGVQAGDPRKNVEEADGIIIGGGNTFNLVKTMQDENILDLIREKILNDTPYTGWSAGCLTAAPTMSTTNDMPIVEPKSFKTLNVLPFQINPHYSDAVNSNLNAETRDVRINEYLTVHKDMYVVGLREGSYLRIVGTKLSMGSVFDDTLKVFKHGMEPRELGANDDLSFLMKR